MSKFLCICIFYCLSYSVISQTALLPVARNGKWGLVDRQGEFKLALQYDYLEFYPKAQKFIYDLNGKKGVLSANGELISPPTYENIMFHNRRFTSIQTAGKWNLLDENTVLFPAKFDSIVPFNETLILLYDSCYAQLYFTENKLLTNSAYISFELVGSSILQTYQADSLYDLYNLENGLVLGELFDTYSTINFNFAYASKNGKTQVIDKNNKRLSALPQDRYIYQYRDWFCCVDQDIYSLYSASKDHYYPVPKLDYVNEIEFPYLIFTVGQERGIWNLNTEKLLIAPQYEGIKRIKNGFMVTDFNRYGILDINGKVIVPALYDRVYVYDNCYVVLQNGKYGLLSTTGATLVEPSLTRVGVYATSVKCYTKAELIVLKIDAAGNVGDRKTYTDYMSVVLEKAKEPTVRSSAINFSGEASKAPSDPPENYGWFKPVLTRMLNDSLIEYRGNWGLKDSTDSVHIKPQFREVAVDGKVGITKAYRLSYYDLVATIQSSTEKKGLVYPLTSNTYCAFQVPFQLVDHESKELISSQSFLSVNTADYADYALARAFDKAPILIDRNAKTVWKDLTYYDQYKNDILLICQGGEVDLRPSNSENSIAPAQTFFSYLGSVQQQINAIEKVMEIENGNWFYIDKNGKQLNDTAFQQAKPFENYLAIVKMNNKWGVIDTGMNIIVPIAFETVKRINLDNQTYFEVSNMVSENYLYNWKAGTLSNSPYTNFENYYAGTWFTQKKGSQEWGLIDTNLMELTAFEYNTIMPFKDKWATVVKNGRKTLIDVTGQEGLPYFKSKRIEALGYDRFAIVSSRGMTLINSLGDTLVEEYFCKSVVESNADYLIYENRSKEMFLLNFKNDETLPKNTRIRAFSLQKSLFLLEKGSKQYLYSLSEKKYILKNLSRIVNMGNQSMVYRGNNGLLGFMSFTGDTLSRPTFKKIEYIDPDMVFVREKKKSGPVRTNGAYYFKGRVTRIRKLNDHYTFSNMQGTGLCTVNCDILIPAEYLKIESYNSHFYKAIRGNNTCDLYTLEGKKINDKPYVDIKAILPTQLIVRSDGFDYLYTGYLNKSLAFQEIQPISSSLFLLHENRRVGVYSSTGENIIPIRYHKIEVSTELFQVSFFNSFGFYDSNGQIIFDPYSL